MNTALLSKTAAAATGESDPVRTAKVRIAWLVLSIVLLGMAALGAMAANDAFNANSQWLPFFRGAPEAVTASFGLCGKSQSGDNCVLDGGAFRYRRLRMDVAGIDAPRRLDADCAQEAELGERAARKLQALLNEGPFEILLIPTKKMTVQLNALRRDGRYFADELIDAGLARRRILFRRTWCP
jgi:endonuclease YncB( thermonuclease family)